VLTDWFLVAGCVTLLLAFAHGLLQRAPLSTSIVYLGVGYLIGPNVFGLLEVNPHTHARGIEWLTAVVIAISIFSGALKMRVPILDRRWLDPIRLAFPGMLLTIGGATLVGHYLLGLSPTHAFLLGAVLAPTDPVLASDVQVERIYEYHRLRFALTGEAGLNDGTAMPMIALALSLLVATPTLSVTNWVVIQLLWGVLGAVLIGGGVGKFAASYMLHLRLVHKQKGAGDRFLALGIIGLAYAFADLAHAIPFVAVFTAGVAVSQIERRTQENPPETVELRVTGDPNQQEVSVNEKTAPAFMLLRVREFTQNLERMGEATVVVLLGSLIRNWMFNTSTLLYAGVLFFAVRPLSIVTALAGSKMNWREQSMTSWFGIRGMASVYYLAYLRTHGASGPLVQTLANVAVAVIAYSIVVHGATVTPLMGWFEKHTGGKEESDKQE
jgi:NhaP-type Na+/H+ or K+/H+ antiporter